MSLNCILIFICFAFWVLPSGQEDTIPAEVLKDIFTKVTDEIREQLTLNINRSMVKRAVVKPKPTATASNRTNPFLIKTSADSILLHKSFMTALKAAKNAKKGSVKLKATPQFCPFQSNMDCDATSKYRNVDGSCNNLNNPLLGKSNTPFKRYINETSYDDGMNDPRIKSKSGSNLPNPRSISLAIHEPSDLPANMTNLGVMFGE